MWVLSAGAQIDGGDALGIEHIRITPAKGGHCLSFYSQIRNAFYQMFADGCIFTDLIGLEIPFRLKVKVRAGPLKGLMKIWST